MATLPINAPRSEVYSVFAGDMDLESVQKMLQSFSALINVGNVKQVHLLFHSNGGVVGHGITLYNFFRALPIDLILYNAGIVSSMGVIAYLGAKRRRTSAHASFMVHHITLGGIQEAPASVLQSLAEATVLDDRRMEAILRQHITMPQEKWAYFNNHDLVLSPEDAVEFGLAHEIAEFCPPIGNRVFSI